MEQYVSPAINFERVWRNILDNKMVEKSQCNMSLKVDHVVTTIMESHNIDTLSVVELQESIKSHVNKILEKTEKVKLGSLEKSSELQQR